MNEIIEGNFRKVEMQQKEEKENMIDEWKRVEAAINETLELTITKTASKKVNHCLIVQKRIVQKTTGKGITIIKSIGGKTKTAHQTEETD